jgi:hypothetical protein
MCFFTRPCASESPNVSEPTLLLFGSDQYMITALSTATAELSLE